jgi:hypothetical protein
MSKNKKKGEKPLYKRTGRAKKRRLESKSH